jgi:HlyD family secretion protein
MQSPSSQGVTYQARLKISGNFTGSARKSSLLPGMRLKAEIVVGRRRVLTYVFNPFLKAIDEAIREP